MGAGGTVVKVQARRRWAAVLAVAVGLCSAPVVINVWPARAATVDAAVLRQRIAGSAGQAYQGYAQSSGMLPLPALPTFDQVIRMLSGTTEMRTWYAAPDRWRVDVIDGGSERDIYQTPGAQYAWDYGENQLSRIVGEPSIRLPRGADVTPPELVRRVLGLATGDRFAPLAGKRVAGIDAAGLRIVPATAQTTVAHIDVWAHPGNGLPLQAEVTARAGVRPVFVTRFLEVHLSVPDAGVLTPPDPRPGIGFTTTDAPDILGALSRWAPVTLPQRIGAYPRRDAVAGVTAAGAYGTGLAQFVVAALPGRFGSRAYDRIAAFGQAVTVPQGTAAILATGLLTVLVVRAERTYLVAGLVDPAVLRGLAAELSEAAG